MNNHTKRLVLFIFILMLFRLNQPACADNFDFFPGGEYDPAIPSPQEVLGFDLGYRPARYAEAVKYFQTLSAASPRAELVEFGETFEGRKLHYLIIGSKDNVAGHEEIRDKIGRLADPRKLSSRAEARNIVQNTPLIIWMLYGIHGDELSSTDAALALAYQLVAGEDEQTGSIRAQALVCIHPMENPDGRERFLAQMQQWKGAVSSTDVQSISHTSVWPWGRGNHYLFDLNRDWILLINPESRARVHEILSWYPQLMVDSHEMGALNTYLFSPGREPVNPLISSTLKQWSHRFAADQAKAFDQFGWSYYTREWLDEWYPGYGSEWPTLLGAVGILYEQAGTDGSSVKRRDGTLLSYRESVHHQFISSMANISTATKNRRELLEDYHRAARENLAPPSNGEPQTYYIVPGADSTRTRRFIKDLLWQGIEIGEATEEFRVGDLKDFWHRKPQQKTLPKGTFTISLRQPRRRLIRAILDFDPRMTSEFLKQERESLLRGKGTKMYEVSGWSLPMALDLEIYQSAGKLREKTRAVSQMPTIPGKVVNPNPAYGFLLDFQDSQAIQALIRLFDGGYQIRAAQKPFTVAGRHYGRGSLLLRLNENPPDLPRVLESIARETSVTFLGLNTALAEKGSDLGGNDFRLLRSPRIALLTGPSISTTSFSALWYLLDRELKIRHSVLNYNRFRNMDLGKYNVIILPSAWGSSETYQTILGKKGVSKLKTWVRAGGTLIGIGTGAAFLADSSAGFSKVQLRRQALDKLGIYQQALKAEFEIGKIRIDSLAIWEGGVKLPEPEKLSQPTKTELQQLKEQDKHLRLFQPRGAILRANLDKDHWLNFGLEEKLPVILYTGYTYLAKPPVQIAARLAGGKHLRLSGLLWPEARSRWEYSAYLTRESLGRGQVILFAGEPFFRAYFRAAGRQLINSLLLGPGMGTASRTPW